MIRSDSLLNILEKMAVQEINPGVDPNNPTPWRKRRNIERPHKCLCLQLEQSARSGKDSPPPHLSCENNCGLSTGDNGRQLVREEGEYNPDYLKGKPVEEICLFHFKEPT